MARIDLLGGEPLPNCPYPSSSIPPVLTQPNGSASPSSSEPDYRLHNPAASFTFSTLAVVCMAFAITILVQYNSVRVFNRTIRDASVRNTLWALFFAAFGMSYGLDAIRFITDIANMGFGSDMEPEPGSGDGVVAPETLDNWMLMFSAFLRILGVLFLTAALEHQLVHRSPGRVKEPRSLFLSGHGYRQRQFNHGSTADARTPLRSSLPRGPSYGATGRNLTVQTNGGTMIGAWPRTPSRNSFSSASAPLSAGPQSSRPPSAQSTSGRRSSRNFNQTDRIMEDETVAEPEVMEDSADSDMRSISSTPPASPMPDENLNPSLTDPAMFGKMYFIPPALVYPGRIEPTPIAFRLHVLSSIIQKIPIFLAVFKIIFSAPPRPADLRTRERGADPERDPQPWGIGGSNVGGRPPSRSSFSIMPGGPGLRARALLLASAFCLVAALIEPSYLSAFASTYWNPDTSICVVPPWWWLDNKTTSVFHNARGTHGWASAVDLSIWIGGLGFLLGFYFVVIEFKRNMEEWIWATVSQVQETFFSASFSNRT
ncbi:hypothetical protein HDU96_010526 [Phlyctochytrium bullatum]|nr:hypothetical protein HDU96_010526 [Phlyctochytrium bullatum]